MKKHQILIVFILLIIAFASCTNNHEINGSQSTGVTTTPSGNNPSTKIADAPQPTSSFKYTKMKTLTPTVTPTVISNGAFILPIEMMEEFYSIRDGWVWADLTNTDNARIGEYFSDDYIISLSHNYDDTIGISFTCDKDKWYSEFDLETHLFLKLFLKGSTAEKIYDAFTKSSQDMHGEWDIDYFAVSMDRFFIDDKEQITFFIQSTESSESDESASELPTIESPGSFINPVIMIEEFFPEEDGWIWTDILDSDEGRRIGQKGGFYIVHNSDDMIGVGLSMQKDSWANEFDTTMILLPLFNFLEQPTITRIYNELENIKDEEYKFININNFFITWESYIIDDYKKIIFTILEEE